MDWNWRPAHAVDLAGYGSSYGLLSTPASSESRF